MKEPDCIREKKQLKELKSEILKLKSLKNIIEKSLKKISLKKRDTNDVIQQERNDTVLQESTRSERIHWPIFDLPNWAIFKP